MEQGVVLLLLLLLSVSCSKAFNDLSRNITVYIGQPFKIDLSEYSGHISLTDATDENIPSWLLWQKNVLSGVPGPNDVGRFYLLVSLNGKEAVDTIDIHVQDEVKNPCKDRSTNWVEMYFDVPFENVTAYQLEKMVEKALDVFDAKREDLRIYSENYISKVRERKPYFQDKLKPGSTVLTYKLPCWETVEVFGIMELIGKTVAFDETEKDIPSCYARQFTTGKVLQRKQRHGSQDSNRVQSGYGAEFVSAPPREVTTIQPLTSRSIRLTIGEDKKPKLLNSLGKFKCQRGIVCDMSVPEETFSDEDGNTSSLKLSISTVSKMTNNWLDDHVLKPSLKIRGVPLEAGKFSFRLDARDHKNQLASAAFEIEVTEPGKPSSHEFIFETDIPYSRLNKPQERLKFYERLQNLVRSLTNADQTKQVAIKAIERRKDGTSRIIWVYPTATNGCPVEFLNLRERDMIQGNGVSSKVHDHMGSEFPVKSAKLKLSEECKTAKVQPVENTTITMVAASEPTVVFSGFPFIVPLAILTVMLLLLLICITTWCILKRKNPKTVQSEFVSKGLPVVFPEEIPQDDETANASTPMLVKEERPPLVISQHENPLYKPPPPLSTASSPRPRNTPTNQRLPPPYVPP